MKNHRNLYKNTHNGITLIALIITIIVLLVLAGVTINMVLGENGLFNKAKTSVGKYENAQTIENTALAGYEEKIIDYTRNGGVFTDEEYNQLKNLLSNSKKNIMEIDYMPPSRELTTTNADYVEIQIPFTKGISNGDKLSYANNGVVIGKGVSIVKVKYRFEVERGNTEPSYYTGMIYINNEANPMCMCNHSSQYLLYLSSENIINVNEGDVITGRIRLRTAASFYMGKCALIVEVIE